MDVTREDVLRCAALAHLNLREEEIEPLRQAMEQMLRHAASLDELDLSGIPPFEGSTQVPLPRRGDEPAPTFSQAQALQNAPEQDRGFFRVPRVL